MTGGPSGGVLKVDVVELRRTPGTRRAVVAEVVLPGMEVGDRQVVDGLVAVDLEVEAIGSDLVAEGRLGLVTRAPCRRCLDDVDEEVELELREVFESEPTDGETWPIDDERIDLEPVVREAALLALPLAPLCGDDCTGPEPERFPTGPVDDGEAGDAGEPPRDPRWAALDELDLG